MNVYGETGGEVSRFFWYKKNTVHLSSDHSASSKSNNVPPSMKNGTVIWIRLTSC